mmetsp:Transcript_41252/g.123153  ORF Transcript_41252/g.123153 Transcript_41252/m.123153 type:complete len:82 (-) Transcript_41252:610-855(-)
MLEPPAAPKTTAQRAGAASAQSVERVAAMPPLPLTLPPPLTPLVLLLLLLLLLSLLYLPQSYIWLLHCRLLHRRLLVSKRL